MWVLSKYQARVSQCSWNKGESVSRLVSVMTSEEGATSDAATRDKRQVIEQQETSDK
jgi:hypothetical protein